MGIGESKKEDASLLTVVIFETIRHQCERLAERSEKRHDFSRFRDRRHLSGLHTRLSERVSALRGDPEQALVVLLSLVDERHRVVALQYFARSAAIYGQTLGHFGDRMRFAVAQEREHGSRVVFQLKRFQLSRSTVRTGRDQNSNKRRTS